jgi:hypothetical protein
MRAVRRSVVRFVLALIVTSFVAIPAALAADPYVGAPPPAVGPTETPRAGPTTTTVAVLGNQVSRPVVAPAEEQAPVAGLALTGSDIAALVTLSGGLLLVGIGLVLRARSKERRTAA